jgi:exodeoxyribonuclease V gamma subunit
MKNASELKSKAVFSNSTEELAHALKERLFFSGGHPFQRRVVVIPNFSIKRYLMLRFAQDPDLNIAAGVEFLPLSHALSELLEKREPTLAELTFQIASVIKLAEKQKKELSGKEREILAPLFDYLDQNSDQCISLSEELARLFLHYGREGEAFLREWKKEAGWQQFLWEKSFFPNASWSPLSECVTHPKRMQEELEIYLFHFTSLPTPLFHFFQQRKATFFLFSPSQFFWGDVCGDREKIFLRGKEKEKHLLDQFLEEQNPLFANLAKAGRDFQNKFLDEEIFSDERYAELKAPIGSLLREVQEEIFTNQPPANQSKKEDGSLQVHAAPNRWREVEVLYDNLLKIVGGNKIVPNEILVLAPDISQYLPYIEAVFGSQESQLDYAIYDLPRRFKETLIQGIDLLLTLAKRRFETSAIFSLFSFSPFLKKFGLTDEPHLFRSWAQKAKILWGEDAKMQSFFLKEEMESHGTWEEGFGRLLMGLAMVPSENEESPSFWPLALVEKKEIESLGLLIKLIRSLKSDLEWIIEEKEMPLSLWCGYLRSLIESYFFVETEEKSLLEELEHLAESCVHITTPFLFNEVIAVLEKQLFQRRNASFKSHSLEAVRFENLQEGTALSSRVIALLGMEEGAFPRVPRNHSLCALEAKQFLAGAEEDRFLFLQLLLSAQDVFLISYQNLSQEDGKPVLPSLVVQELLSYVKCDLTRTHTALPCDPANFISRESYSQTQFAAAKSLLAEEEKRFFIPHLYTLSPLNIRAKRESFVVDLKELRKLLKNPLRFYFNLTLDLFLSWENEESEFALSPLVRSLFVKDALTQPVERLIKRTRAKGELPQGVFGEIAARRMQEEVRDAQEFLAEFNISRESIIEVEWEEGCKQPREWKKGKWVVPALRVPLDQDYEALLVGKLEGVTDRGLIFHGKEELSDLLLAFPDLLLFSLFAKREQPELFLMKEKKSLSVKIQEPLVFLRNYLNYYQLAKESPSPLFSEWVKVILQGKEEELERKIASWKTSGAKDPYREWLFARDGMPSASAIFQNWTPRLRELFSGLPFLDTK